ncbi:PTS sugar transporter subunit IIB [uncultured Aeromicrobium sp.]|uniref:PTS sugar transporter subunit IIB n=1 Tax=uncultured Aeromicrobium sp. TaxID=337820 RepID=UPI0025F68D3E|nr:PTS sugar transporter subunit IIB [uncultured Aeromicrobium sp.]
MNIVTVCGMGFGTSMMLAMQIRGLLADEGVSAKVEPVDLSSFKTMQADIVVAPRDMATQVSQGSAKHVVLIDNLVDKNEVATKVLGVIRSIQS